MHDVNNTHSDVHNGAVKRVVQEMRSKLKHIFFVIRDAKLKNMFLFPELELDHDDPLSESQQHAVRKNIALKLKASPGKAKRGRRPKTARNEEERRENRPQGNLKPFYIAKGKMNVVLTKSKDIFYFLKS